MNNKKQNLPFEVGVVARAIIFNSKGKLLVNSFDRKNWTFPGGFLEAEDKTTKTLCVKEVYEETGLKVRTDSMACFDEVSCVRYDIWDKEESKSVSYEHVYHTVGVYYHCSIIGNEKLDPNWKDLGAGNIKTYNKFVDEGEFEKLKGGTLKSFQKMSFEEIGNLKSVCLEFINLK